MCTRQKRYNSSVSRVMFAEGLNIYSSCNPCPLICDDDGAILFGLWRLTFCGSLPFTGFNLLRLPAWCGGGNSGARDIPQAPGGNILVAYGMVWLCLWTMERKYQNRTEIWDILLLNFRQIIPPDPPLISCIPRVPTYANLFTWREQMSRSQH